MLSAADADVSTYARRTHDRRGAAHMSMAKNREFPHDDREKTRRVMHCFVDSGDKMCALPPSSRSRREGSDDP